MQCCFVNAVNPFCFPDPNTRYNNLNLNMVAPCQVTHLYEQDEDSDVVVDDAVNNNQADTTDNRHELNVSKQG